MYIEQLKAIKKELQEDKSSLYELLSLILNAGLLLPNTYMLVTILFNEMKKEKNISLISIPYMIMIIYSSLKIDLELDKKRYLK